MWQEIYTFIRAIVVNWSGYVTGGVLIAGVWLWGLLRKKAPGKRLTKTVGIRRAIIGLIMAFLTAWHDQYQAAQEATAKLIALTVPQLDLKVDSFSVSKVHIVDCPELDNKILVQMTANLTNDGASSIAENFSLLIERPDGTTYGPLNPYETLDKKELTFSDDKNYFVLSQKNDLLNHKAFDPKVEMGARVRGFLLFPVPQGEHVEDVEKIGTKFILSCADVTGRRVESVNPWMGGHKHVLHQPGMEYPYTPTEQQQTPLRNQ